MGGQRFKSKDAVRINAAAHDALSLEVTDLLADHGIQAQSLPYVRNKESFGDIDLLCRKSQTHRSIEGENDSELMKALLDASDAVIAETVGAEAHHRPHLSDGTLGMLVNSPAGKVQVDLISVEDDLYDFVFQQLSWGDAGSLAGVIARQMGLKVGMNGVFLTHPGKYGELKIKIDITHAELLDILDLDARHHQKGFHNREEIFRWLSNSRYFNPCIWQFDWITSKSRARAVKRPTYMAFLDWMESSGSPQRYYWGEKRGDRKDDWISYFLSEYPAVRRELDALLLAEQKKEDLAKFFNGNVIGAHTGVRGEQLGHLMNAIRKDIGESELSRMADNGDSNTLLAKADQIKSKLETVD